MTLLLRLALMLVAFAASAAAVIPFVLGLMALIFRDKSIFDPTTLEYAFIALVILMVLTSVPALLVIVVAEWKRIRHWRYFVTAGGLIALALSTLFGFAPNFRGEGAGVFLSVFLFAGGLLAGLVYWAIAGRTAGSLRDAWAARGLAS